MKVILTTDVASLGREGDVLEVAQGYAQNFLIPRKMAVAATSGNLKQLEFKRSALEKREAEHRSHAEDLAGKISSQAVTVAAKAGVEGKLYGSVTAKDIVHAVREQLGVELDKKQIVIKEPIKQLGDHEIGAHIYPEVTAALTVSVVASEGMPEDAVPEDAVPEDAVPEDAVPEDAVPEDAVPEDAVAADVAAEAEAEVPEDATVEAEALEDPAAEEALETAEEAGEVAEEAAEEEAAEEEAALVQPVETPEEPEEDAEHKS